MSNKTNPRTRKLIVDLEKLARSNNAGVWSYLAQSLSSPRQNWSETNLGKLERVVKVGETVIIPGKILGSGILNKKINVYAFNASSAVSETIKNAGGTYGTIEELIKSNPSGKGVRLIK